MIFSKTKKGANNIPIKGTGKATGNKTKKHRRENLKARITRESSSESESEETTIPPRQKIVQMAFNTVDIIGASSQSEDSEDEAKKPATM